VDDTDVLNIALDTMIVGAKLAAPVLITSLVIGFAISLLQAVTQIQEVTLTFVPKMIGVGVALLVSGNWMLGVLTAYTNDLFAALPDLLSGA
jgi:flagellar biosynthetic protein FliQ